MNERLDRIARAYALAELLVPLPPFCGVSFADRVAAARRADATEVTDATTGETNGVVSLRLPLDTKAGDP
jgi:hypothetical protein